MIKLSSDKKSTDSISEVHALLDVMKAIKIKEMRLKKESS